MNPRAQQDDGRSLSSIFEKAKWAVEHQPVGGFPQAVGSIGLRIAAYIFDRILVFGVTLMLVLPMIVHKTQAWVLSADATVTNETTFAEYLHDVLLSAGTRDMLGLLVTSMLIYVLVSALYVIPAVALWSATPGKKMFSLMIVEHENGEYPVGWWVSIKRWLLPSLSSFMGAPGGIINTLGYLWIFTNDEHRGWHDYLAGTVVVSSKLRDAQTHAKERVIGNDGQT